jgi:very-short-patch-repair endonuclease
VENKSGAFSNHITVKHNMTPDEHLKKFPEDVSYFAEAKKIMERREFLSKQENCIVCPICGESMKLMTESHLETKHKMTMYDFKKKYPMFKVSSKTTSEKLKMCAHKANLNVSKKRFVSKYEKEIQDFLIDNGIHFEPNRQILDGKEIDILIEDKKLGIEFDGLYWHSEYGNKDHCYHLNKTKTCNAHGYSLIHIFEDEYVNHKDLVLKKLSHILGITNDLPKIAGRKITVREIYKHDAELFLDAYHIQGFLPSTVYLGGFYKDELVAVMTFRNKNMRNPNWELVRFATSDKYIYQGVGGKMFSYFVKNYNPDIVVSFADRRWTIDKNWNLYTKLGFILDSETKPSYYYYGKSKGVERLHKFNFRKQILSKKYGLPMTMTETEMANMLGYKKIFDCGLFKYVWYRDKETIFDGAVEE